MLIADWAMKLKDYNMMKSVGGCRTIGRASKTGRKDGSPEVDMIVD